jgi:glycosyltransferase involved in cell wall biosynthesis
VLEVVEALRQVIDRAPCRLVIAGDGPDELRVRERVSSLGLTELVTFAGYVIGDALMGLYRDAAIFVLPTWHTEGFPTVISEAMDAGLPIITTRSRGAGDHLQDGINARFVAPRDAPALAATILRLLANPDERLAMGQANQRKVRDFSPEAVGPAYLTAIRDIVGEPKPLASRSG